MSRFKKQVQNKIFSSCRQVCLKKPEEKIENCETQATFIKMEAFENFISVMAENNEHLLSSYGGKLFKHSILLQQLTGQNNSEHTHQQSLSKPQNDLLVLQLENQKLKMKEKLLRQKVQCERVLRQKIKGREKLKSPMREQKRKEGELLREEIQTLTRIIALKQELKQEKEKTSGQQVLMRQIEQVILQNSQQANQIIPSLIQTWGMSQ